MLHGVAWAMVVYCAVFRRFITTNEWTKKPRIVLVRWNFPKIVHVFVLNLSLSDNIRIRVEFWKTSHVLFWLGAK